MRNLPRSIVYYEGEPKPTMKDFVMRMLNEENQRKYLLPLIKKIKNLTPNKDDQVRIAVSLVQNIPYDYESLKFLNTKDRYPYEVIYDNKGVCGEKSKLLAFILRELGYGVVLFYYEQENHMAVGIRCPKQYSQYIYRGEGYCFIETAKPTIITDNQEVYVGVGKLFSKPQIIYVSDGATFQTVYEEYKDAREWIKLNQLSKASGGYLSLSNYRKWLFLANKYGIEIPQEENTSLIITSLDLT